jgi:homoserine kinase type II
MAVFTPVTEAQAARLLERYTVGKLVSLTGIPSGIENSNFFLTTTDGQYVLTLFEKLTPRELPFYLNLMAHLASHGIPCPRPVADQDDRFLGELNGKPASIVTRLAGRSEMAPGPRHCLKVGETVARMHLAARTYPAAFDNPRGPHWWAVTAPRVQPFLTDDERTLLHEEMRFQSTHRHDDLPRGVVHADLFRDNVLFAGEDIGGVIDFYFAGGDAFMFDLAVVANDWCMRPDASLDPERTRALLAGYLQVRTPTDVERAAWPVMLRAGALRFWLSRLDDFHLPRAGEIIHPHDPHHFKRILQRHVSDPAAWPIA